MKKITFTGKPGQRSPTVSADDWVAGRTVAPASAGPIKRLTIDIPESLHLRVKSQCALKGEKMADVVRGLLEKEFPNPA